jgi:hypothetical protein
MRILPGENCRPRWTASGGRVELGPAHPIRSEPVQVRSVDLSAVAAEVAETEIVREDHKNVRALPRLRTSRGDRSGERQERAPADSTGFHHHSNLATTCPRRWLLTQAIAKDNLGRRQLISETDDPSN